MSAEIGTDIVSQDILESFAKDGYAVLENFTTQEEVRRMREQAEKLMRDYDAGDGDAAVFSTTNQEAQSKDKFLKSGATIDMFMEEKDNRVVNKIGHALHDLDPVFREWSRSPRVAALMRRLDFRRPLPVQSMYILKHSLVGGECVPHQDSTFLWTDPEPSTVGLWLALEDATVENGCLWSLPGSQKEGVHKRFVRGASGVTFRGQMPEYDLAKFVPIEVKSGSLVLLHGANVHMSLENTSPHSRHAFSVHVAEGAPGYSWPHDNWLQRPPELPFEPLYTD